MSIRLGSRLAAISQYVPKNARLGDIGTDHAYLPIFLCEQDLICSAVAVDIHQGPYESAKAAVDSHDLEGRISLRLGNGLLPLSPGEVDTLTIAGMGGNTILEILSGRPDVLDHVETLILQPQGAEGKVREVLLTRGWLLEDESLVEEDGKIYVVMVYGRKAGLSLTDVHGQAKAWLSRLPGGQAGLAETAYLDLNYENLFMTRAEVVFWQVGPLILKKGGFLLQRLLDDRIKALNIRIKEMQKGEPATVGEKIAAAEIELKVIEALRTTV